MGLRTDFHDVLVDINGSDEVYFQPPANVRMVYPAIVYELSNLDSTHANNDPYRIAVAYLVTHIDRDPDSVVPMKLARLRTSNFSRRFVADGLNHTVFNIYY